MKGNRRHSLCHPWRQESKQIKKAKGHCTSEKQICIHIKLMHFGNMNHSFTLSFLSPDKHFVSTFLLWDNKGAGHVSLNYVQSSWVFSGLWSNKWTMTWTLGMASVALGKQRRPQRPRRTLTQPGGDKGSISTTKEHLCLVTIFSNEQRRGVGQHSILEKELAWGFEDLDSHQAGSLMEGSNSEI